MKKIFSLLLCINLIVMPVFADYDFSDEAQEAFDRQQYLNLQPVDFSKTRNRNEIKNNRKNTLNEIEERTKYTPADNLLLDIEQETSMPKQNSQIYVPIQDDLFKQTNEQPKNVLYGSVVKVPSGTRFDVTFDSGVSSGSMEKNDLLTVRLTEDLRYNGQLIAPAGSLVYGTTADAKNAGYAYGSGTIILNFNQILTPNGNMLQITTKNIVMKAKSERALKMTRDVALGALGSLLLGAAFTAMGGGGDWGKNMLIYGGIGALGGGLHGAMQRGEEVSIPDGTTINVTLTEPLTASPYNF